MLAADRRLVDRAVPGSRVTVTGIMSIMSQQGKGGRGGGNTSIRTPYLQVRGGTRAEGGRVGDWAGVGVGRRLGSARVVWCGGVAEAVAWPCRPARARRASRRC
eukprot:3894150-Prymnesium_polylepis.1